MTVKVLGVDPGTLITGYGVVSESKGKKQCHAWGVIRSKSREPMPRRLKAIADGLRKVLLEHNPDCLALEESFFAKDPKSALKLGQARGVIMLVAEEAETEVAEYAPLKIKQTVTGYGQADKEQVRIMVRSILSLKENPEPHDASDALATAITHLHHITSPSYAIR